jgi:hypothetical protein
VQLERDKFDAEKQDKGARLQMDQQASDEKVKMDQQAAQDSAAIHKNESDNKIRLASDAAALDRQKIEQEHRLKVAAHNNEVISAMSTDTKSVDAIDAIERIVTSQQQLAAGQAMLSEGQKQLRLAIVEMTKALSAPKMIIRGPDGRAAGVVSSNAPTSGAIN